MAETMHQEFAQLVAETAAEARSLGACDALRCVGQVRELLRGNGSTEAIALASVRMIQAVHSARFDQYLKNAQRARRCLPMTSSGQKATYGTREERQHLYEQYQKGVDQKRADNPKWSYHAICSAVAKEYGCSYKTIERNTNDPAENAWTDQNVVQDNSARLLTNQTRS